ncbi:hypothetical protein E6C27_scaffold2741G00140 [Cucumis melo var. makuwa]|uniref:Uncharacterized protein n=1 Tax=Cucumis melo var. makuwa TaxID=1194695 RepID=A0A5A7TQ73_CUCMM|nr:hypothetical protein E6C27_scaffold2741G00140 [Cucumis melo var. makuwa]
MKGIMWPRADWKRTSTDRLQLYLHQLTRSCGQCVVFFYKKKIIPMWHDSTVPNEFTLLFYGIMMKQAFNLGYVMNGEFLGWMRNPKGAKAFLTTKEKLCLKYLPTIARYLKIEIGGKCNLAKLNHVTTLN